LRYRRDIVWKNLVNSFPDKTRKELRQIEKDFYKNLADVSVETLKALTMSEEALLSRVKIDNSVVLQCCKEGYAVFAMTPHFSNWEWLLVACSNQLGFPLHVAYQRLRNSLFDHLMIKIRTRFGVILHEKGEVVRDIYKMGNKSYVMAMAADQRPFSGEKKYWTEFMNQDAAFYTGTETLARRLDIRVVYGRMKRIRRGYYEVDFEEVSRDPRKTASHEITEKFIRIAECSIYEDPVAYLWSHDRWKHKKSIE
jgi:KDO2-lipid IV(A) lauroyltransferase